MSDYINIENKLLAVDRDIIERLDTQSNKAGYIKRLIREDIERSNKETE